MKMIFEKSWQSDVRQIFKELLTNQPDARIVILGIGDKPTGDDQVGGVIARNLLRKSRPSRRLLILDGSLTSESFANKLEAFTPDLILILDAVDFDAVPGSVRLFDGNQISSTFPSTHKLSLNVLSDYLRRSLTTCAVYILGIQLQTLEFDKALSSANNETVQAVIQFLFYLIENP